jgi:carbamoyltransferase
MKERESSSMHEIKKCYLDNVYLGAEFSPSQIEVAIDKMIDLSVCSVEECAEIEEVIAKRLADNKIVARMAGKMEWGARALGNRSILANPKRWENVEKINSMIKMRDFWMPFAPSMLVEKTKEYLINPKNLYSQYMMFAFETTSSSETHLSAAVHPRDRTARAQFVDNKINPSYHKLISKFYEITGQGAVLNTSFNLHGYPLVNSPEDAIDVFLRSGLDCLAIENYLITKK